MINPASSSNAIKGLHNDNSYDSIVRATAAMTWSTVRSDHSHAILKRVYIKSAKVLNQLVKGIQYTSWGRGSNEARPTYNPEEVLLKAIVDITTMLSKIRTWSTSLMQNSDLPQWEERLNMSRVEK